MSHRSVVFTCSSVSVSAESLPIGGHRPPLQRACGAARRVGSFGGHRRAATTGIWVRRGRCPHTSRCAAARAAPVAAVCDYRLCPAQALTERLYSGACGAARRVGFPFGGHRRAATKGDVADPPKERCKGGSSNACQTASFSKKAHRSCENCRKFSGVITIRRAFGKFSTKASRPLADFLRPDLTSIA